MTSRLKTAVVTLLTGLIVCAVTLSSASAAEWKINGVALKGSAAFATTARVYTDLVLRVSVTGGNIKILCNGGIFGAVRGEINATNTGMAERLTFEGCATIEPKTKCALNGTTIQTEPVKATIATLTAPQDNIIFTPLTKKVFAEVSFSPTNTCALTETEPISGSVTLRMPFGQTESAAQALEGLGSSENNSLETAGSKAYIEGGRVLLLLQSGSKWSFS